jgi:hypothetical protein
MTVLSIGLAGAAVLFVILVTHKPGGRPKDGYEAFLDQGSPARIPLAVDASTCEEMDRAFEKQDAEKLQRLKGLGRIYLVQNKVNVRDVEHVRYAVRVRIAEGPDIGREGWVPILWVQYPERPQ